MSPQKGVCQAARGLSGQLLSPWNHKFLRSSTPTRLRTARTQERWLMIVKSPETWGIHPYIYWFSRRKSTARRTQCSCFWTNTSFLHSSIAMCLGAGNQKPDCWCIERENWNSNPSPSDSRAQTLSNYALVPSQWLAQWHDISMQRHFIGSKMWQVIEFC